MKQLIKSNLLTISGFFVGSVAGFLYWYYIGCASGNCYIQSSPIRMTLYGAILGLLLFNLFQPKEKK